MDLAINVLLVFSGAVTAIAAIGGVTWHPGTQSLAKRITSRGWVSIIALIATVVCGTVKEITTKSDSARAEATIARLEKNTKAEAARAEETTARLEGQLTEARLQLDENRRILRNVVLSSQPSEHVMDQVMKTVKEVAREKGFATEITGYMSYTHFNFLNDRGRVGFFALSKETVAELSILPEKKLRSAISTRLFGKWGRDQLDADWEVISTELQSIVRPIVQNRFNSEAISIWPARDHSSIVFYPMDVKSNQLSKTRLIFTRQELIDLLSSPPYIRSAIVATRSETLK